MKVFLARTARIEMTEAFNYYEHEQQGLGQRFLDDIAPTPSISSRNFRTPGTLSPTNSAAAPCAISHTD